MTIFRKIIDREIPADIIYEDELCLAFRDINPQAPIHFLVIPRQDLGSLAEAEPDHHTLLGHLLLKAAEVARSEGLVENGYRVVLNTGPQGGQTVDHLHLHVLGGRYMGWPPG
jgi:histidine triad (HIT) family protein